MQAILTQDVTKVGQKGQLVNVKAGYFRNFLSPNGLAIVATETLVEKAQEVNARIEAEQKELEKKAQEQKQELEAKSLVLTEKLNKKGTLYSKVNEKNITEAVKEQFSMDITANNITIKEAIKTVGEHKVMIKLANSVTAVVNVVVNGEES
jgi:large subunit ribosomal protein L9